MRFLSERLGYLAYDRRPGRDESAPGGSVRRYRRMRTRKRRELAQAAQDE
ncbi:hypothetical protein ACFRQM_21970 [Streptomyces sp. NPDC056831]